MLLGADLGIHPGHGELYEQGWSAPKVVCTEASGVLAGEEIVGGRVRRYYRLTVRGSATLESESKQRLAVSKEALRRLGRPGGRTPRLAGGFA